MQRKGKIKYNIRNKLHSIPKLKKNVKSNVVYSIPSVCMLVLCLGLVGLLGLLNISTIMANSTYAKVPVATGDSDSAPSLSLSLSNVNSEGKLVSNPTTPGSTVTVSTDVTVDVSNAEDYSLTLAFDNTTLVNGNTTISGINTTSSTLSDNTWGYKWDNASSYTTPSTSGTTLTSNTNPTSGTALSTDGSVNFTKTLTFGAKFSDKAEAGTYATKGTLMLAASPKETTTAKWSSGIDSGLDYMQEITTGFCKDNNNISVHDSITLKDIRDDTMYTIVKMADNRCWMTDNLLLKGPLTLTANDSNVQSNWSLPAPLSTLSTSNFSSSSYDAIESYFSSQSATGATMYYSWATTTAGTGTTSVINTVVNTSLCPKNWLLPSGTGENSLYNMITAENIQTVAAIQASPYNFKHIGRVRDGVLGSETSESRWWTSTAGNAQNAEALRITTSISKAYNSSRYYGSAIRCVAQY